MRKTCLCLILTTLLTARLEGKSLIKILDAIHHCVSEKVKQRVLQDQRWKGREVKVIDGTGITLPDTPKNQAAFPQPARQLPDCRFPVMKMVA